jgi:hypothetical protein
VNSFGQRADTKESARLSFKSVGENNIIVTKGYRLATGKRTKIVNSFGQRAET